MNNVVSNNLGSFPPQADLAIEKQIREKLQGYDFSLCRNLGQPIKVALVGRPNVGKSSFFNYFIKHKRAITFDRPGITRDRNYGVFIFDRQYAVELIDTGGIFEQVDLNHDAEIRLQAELAIQEAHAIIVLFDGRQGLMPQDNELVQFLRKQKKVLMWVINKADTDNMVENVKTDFYALGLEELHSISVAHSRGMTSLMQTLLTKLQADFVFPAAPTIATEDESDLDEVDERDDVESSDAKALGNLFSQDSTVDEESDLGAVEVPASAENTDTVELVQSIVKNNFFYDQAPILDEEFSEVLLQEEGADAINRTESVEQQTSQIMDQLKHIKVAIIGRPNVGKSTLLNRLTGKSRSAVSPVAGTTRDAINETVQRGQTLFEFIDTAGLRRKFHITDEVEKFSASSTVRAIKEAHISLLLIDGKEGLTEQDLNIAGLAEQFGCAVIVVVNKWEARDRYKYPEFKQFEAWLDFKMGFLSYAPKIPLSALTGRNAEKTWQWILQTYAQYSRRIPTSQVNQWLKVATMSHTIPLLKGHRERKFYYATQSRTTPPELTLFSNTSQALESNYEGFLKNHFRQTFKLKYVPVQVKIKSHKKKGDPRHLD